MKVSAAQGRGGRFARRLHRKQEPAVEKRFRAQLGLPFRVTREQAQAAVDEAQKRMGAGVRL
jgi:uncharacterized protein YoaH (UPF0181 family)